jgi:hypothetical protein
MTWPIETNPLSVKFIVMPLQAVEPQRLYRQISEPMRVAILAGKFSVGDERQPRDGFINLSYQIKEMIA